MTKDEALRMAIEPVAWTWLDNGVDMFTTDKDYVEYVEQHVPVGKLYTTPPSREWQSLSGEEFVAIAKSIWGDNLGMGDGYGYTVACASSYATIEPSSKMLLLYRKIDEALREKNG